MTHHPTLRVRALALRQDEGLTIDEIAERLALPRGTIYSWVRGIPIGRTSRQTDAQLRATRRMQQRCKRVRDDAYATGAAELYRTLGSRLG